MSCARAIILSLLTALLLFIQTILACEWSYPIWGIRTKTADPLFRFSRNGRNGYIDSEGKIVIQPTLPKSDNFFGEFHEGLVAVKEGNGYQYLDSSGVTVFRVDAWLALDFSEGLAPASPNGRDYRWGFLDRTGQFAVSPKYYGVKPFSEGLARISVSSQVGGTGYIDHTGSFAIPPHLSYGSDFHEGRAAVIIDGSCRIINGGSCGRAEFAPSQILPALLSQITPAIAPYTCRYSFIDQEGKPVSNLRFDDAKDFSEGLAPVRIGHNWGYVDRDIKIVIAPQFENAEEFSEGVAAVRQDGKVGFIDGSGSYVIPPQFASAEPFSNDRALILESNGAANWARRYIDRSGKPAFPGEFQIATSFSHGLAQIALTASPKGPFAWINTSGKRVFTYKAR